MGRSLVAVLASVALLVLAACSEDDTLVAADEGPADTSPATTEAGTAPIESDAGSPGTEGLACLTGSWTVQRTDSVALPGTDGGELRLDGGVTVTFGDGTWTLVGGEITLADVDVDAGLEVDGTAEGTFVAGDGPAGVVVTLSSTDGTASGRLGDIPFDLDLAHVTGDFVPEGDVDVRCSPEELVLKGRIGATVTFVPA